MYICSEYIPNQGNFISSCQSRTVFTKHQKKIFLSKLVNENQSNTESLKSEILHTDIAVRDISDLDGLT